MKLTVLGAGAWGTAIAVAASRSHATRLWARDAAQVSRMRSLRRNTTYLPDVALPPALQLTGDLDGAIGHARGGLVVVATPMAALQAMLERLPDAFDTPVVWLCKGFQAGTAWLGHEVAAEVAAGLPVGVLTGPSFAAEVARGRPTALVVASRDSRVRDAAVEAFHGGALRVYTSDDPVGAEVGGAVKNVLAIATGIADGMSLGLNARAALVTRGLAEMTRLGVALGADAATFMGLSGLGDLVLTATGDLSRNRTVGLRLAEGVALDRIVAELGHVAEGVASAPMVLHRAHARGVEMPIVEQVVEVLGGRVSPEDALSQLLGRDARPEQA